LDLSDLANLRFIARKERRASFIMTCLFSLLILLMLLMLDSELTLDLEFLSLPQGSPGTENPALDVV